VTALITLRGIIFWGLTEFTPRQNVRDPIAGESAMTTAEYKPLTDAYKKVLKKEKLKAFYIHLLAYFVVNTVLFVTNIESNPAVFWGCFLGWGSGVIAILIFKILPMDKQLEAQRIEVETMAAQSR
jgi:hypothetical protein